MFPDYGYPRKSRIITTTYKSTSKWKPAVEVSISDAESDSDLEEHSVYASNKNIRSSPNRNLGNSNDSNGGNDTGTTAIKHPISNYLDMKLQESGPNYTVSFEDIQQEVVAVTQPQSLPSPPLQLQSQKPVLSATAEHSIEQQLQLESFSNPSLTRTSLEMDSLMELYEAYQQPIQYGQQQQQQQQQILDAPFTIPSQPLPSLVNSQLDWESLRSLGQNISALPPPDSFTIPQQPQQQLDELTSFFSSNEHIASLSGLMCGNDPSFTPFQQQQQQQQLGINTNDFSDTTDDNRINKERNISQRQDASVSVFQSTTASGTSTTLLPSSTTSSSFDIFDIPELPIRCRISKQASLQSSTTNENKEAEQDVFDLPPVNNTPKVTKTYKSSARTSLPSSSSSASIAAKAKKSVDTSFDVFDFPEEDGSNIVELKIVSTKASSSSINDKREHKYLKRSISHVNFSSTTKGSSRHQQQQRRKPSPLKKSKSEASAKLSEKRVRFAPEILVSTYNRASFDRSQPLSAPTFSNEKLEKSKNAEAVSFSIPSSSSQQQLPTKRKRNLVSRLRNATGAPSAQAATGLSLRQYNFGDDDDDDNDGGDDGENDKDQAEKSRDDDELDYRQRMERELVAMMENEFGRENNGDQGENGAEQENTSRSQYQPRNATNVRVTYKSNKKQQNNYQEQHHQDREMIELDNLLDKLRAGSTDL